MQNAAHENQPQPQNLSAEIGVLSILLGMEIFGLGIGLLIYYAENSAMGNLCREPLYLAFLPFSMYLQFTPFFLALVQILRLYPHTEKMDSWKAFNNFWMAIFFESVWFQGGVNLGIQILFTSKCATGIKSSGAYIVLWIVTGFSLAYTLGMTCLNISYIFDYFQNRVQFYRSLGVRIWFDRKKRARVLRQLVRCAGTKEGCRLLANQYCGELFGWQDILTHTIVKEYIWTICGKLVRNDSSDLASRICSTCGEPLQLRVEAFSHTLLPEEVHHLSCAQRWDLSQMNQHFPNARDLVISLEELALH